jgi:hypothetical protein
MISTTGITAMAVQADFEAIQGAPMTPSAGRTPYRGR